MPIDRELLDHLVATTGLPVGEVERLAQDVLAYHAEPVVQFVRRRHAELRTYGVPNAEIFRRLQGELADRVVAAPRMSQRQLRRAVYG